MSVLLHLPNELCYDIMSRWINYESDFYMTVLLIDYTVKYNADLRLLLLNHFNFCKSLEKKYFMSRIDFNWEEGYSCDVIEDCIDNWCRCKNHLQVEGINPIARRVIYRYCTDASSFQEAVTFVNNCQRLKEVEFWSDQILIGIAQHILEGLTIMEIGTINTDIRYHSGFEHTKFYCRQLTKFLVIGYRGNKNDCQGSPVMNEIVANNPNLQSIHIPTNNDIFNNLINGNYTNLERIILSIREEVNVSNIFKILNKYSNIIHCEINSSFVFRFDWEINVIDEDTGTMIDQVVWTLYNLDDKLLCDVAEYSGETTTSIKIISENALFNCSLKSFKKLNTLDIMCRLSHINWMDTLQSLPATLNNLQLLGISVSLILAVLRCCRSLKHCHFHKAIDDAQQDPTIVTQLRTTLLEYSECLTLFEISFDNRDDYFGYDHGELTVVNMKHYLNAEKCFQDHGYWTETLKQVSRCEDEIEYTDDEDDE